MPMCGILSVAFSPVEERGTHTFGSIMSFSYGLITSDFFCGRRREWRDHWGWNGMKCFCHIIAALSKARNRLDLTDAPMI